MVGCSSSYCYFVMVFDFVLVLVLVMVFVLELVIVGIHCEALEVVISAQEWQWTLGSLSIFCVWLDLILFIRKFPTFGEKSS